MSIEQYNNKSDDADDNDDDEQWTLGLSMRLQECKNV